MRSSSPGLAIGWAVIVAWLACSGHVRAEASGKVEEVETSSLELAPPEHFELGNGLEVLLQEAHQAPIAAVRLVYEVGSRDDPEGHYGLAHLVEHLTYRGSKHLEDLQASELLARAGELDSRGITTPDYTEYYHLVPASALELALWIESERMAFTLEHFTEATLNVEKAIIARELARPAIYYQGLDHLLLGGVWGHSHVYARASWSSAHPTASTLANAQWFFQRGYRPANARLVIVGDFRAAEARALVERHFGPIVNPKAAFARAPLACGSTFETESVALREPIALPRYSLVWGLDSPFSTSGLAGEMELSRLSKTLGEALVLAQGKASEVLARRIDLDCGSFARIDVVLRRDVTPEHIDADVAAARAAVVAFDWAEALPRLKRKKRRAILAGLEDMAAFSALHSSALRRQGRPFDANQVLLTLSRLDWSHFYATKPAFERVLIGRQFNAGVSSNMLGVKMRARGVE